MGRSFLQKLDAACATGEHRILRREVLLYNEQGKWTFSCPRSRLTIWSRETGSAVPSHVSLLVLHVCLYVWSSHVARVRTNRVRLPILVVVSWRGKTSISLPPFAPEKLVSRDGFGSPVPRQPAHLHIQAESAAYLRDSSRFPRRRLFMYLNRHTPSRQPRNYLVTQMRTDAFTDAPAQSE